jgi:hypothetical protein
VKGISIAKQVTLVLAVWFAIAVFSSASGATLALRPPFPQVVLCGLLGLLFVAFGYLKAFRSWLYAISLHWLVAVHISRFVGAYFLILYHLNELPFAFAVPGGCGDIVVATFATVLVNHALPFTSHATCALLDLEYIGIYRHIIRRDDGNTTCASRP